ncbi:hypothetical protein ACJMK2_010412 [Sinanodonta woodiana]|uniref:ZP domain-containing protein n=1 Tax=Sinanodonta woodiana TaxID=1069815 RepID=A0ABD3VGV9_SINWO
MYNGSNIVTYGSDYEFVIPVKCVYPRNSNISTNYIPIVQQVKILERRNGQLDLTMRQYEAEDYNHAVPFNAYPRQVPLNNDIFIRVAMENNVTGLGLSADNCFATSTPSPVDPNWYQLISSGCPVNNAKIHPSGINDVKFSFHAFNFRHNTSGIVYVHCQVSVCLDTDPACVVGCVTRKKRSASVREGTITSNLISTGPFVLTADEGGVAMSTVVAAVSIAVAVIAAVIAIIGWTRKSKKGADS